MRPLWAQSLHGEYFGEPNSSSHGVREAEQAPVSATASSSAGGFQ